jgi:hypothetical protein
MPDAWSNAKQYLQGDTVTHGGHTYEWGSANPSLGVEPPAGDWTRLDADAAAPSGAGMAATSFTTETVPDPVRGGGATMQCLVFPVDQPVLAIKLQGDAFPRWLLCADPGGSEGLVLGNGTDDPVNAGNAVYLQASNGQLSISSFTNGWQRGLTTIGGPLQITGDLRFNDNTESVVLGAPDGSWHRVRVANDGTLSTEVV